MKNEFASLKLDPLLIKNLQDLNFKAMTPVQAEALPHVLEGKDVLAQAKTGSGKTAAFGLGILNTLDVNLLRPQSLILCPTRELAEQVAKEVRTLARAMANVRVLTLCGGSAKYHQQKSLEHGAHILVGTPGRVLKLLREKSIETKHIKSFVLDEADKMLEMGFHTEIINISSFIPKKRQSLLFSATFPENIDKLSKDVLVEPVDVRVDTGHDSGTIEQILFKVKGHPDKFDGLMKILGFANPERCIVFCKTKQISDEVARFLNKNGVVSQAIHGDLEQNERTVTLTKFANKSLSVLVATDVAARGLDIKELDAVINFDLPSDPEQYIHRVGRTGRAGETGKAYGMYIDKEMYKVEAIEDLNGLQIPLKEMIKLPNKAYELTPAMKTIYVGGGKKNKLRPGDLLGALVHEAELAPESIGKITVLNILSYVAIQREFADQAVNKLSNGKIKNRKFKVGLA
tara:strand:- start:13 stop:1389 length:1377 start_codon:yes stop_codon:yes gene_type:complete